MKRKDKLFIFFLLSTTLSYWEIDHGAGLQYPIPSVIIFVLNGITAYSYANKKR